MIESELRFKGRALRGVDRDRFRHAGRERCAPDFCRRDARDDEARAGGVGGLGEGAAGAAVGLSTSTDKICP